MDTISAISTPYGTGGIAIVRISGPEAIRIAEGLTCPLADAKGYSVRHGYLHRPASPDRVQTASLTEDRQEVLDEVLVTVFRAPHSFTGEDVVEIACHGSLYIQQEVLRWLTDAGCRMARAGEFTQRAFANGKMDLTQAEAVADLIAAETKAEKDLALSQLRGGISSELAGLREQLLHFTSLIELELDFADHEELEFADRSELTALAEKIDTTIAGLVGSFKTGNAIRNGIPVVITGATNAGKSTLLNALLGEERAIVSDIHGTTRDTVEDTMVIDGILFRFIDTAGIRETNDTIEALGIERSRKAVTQAQIVIHVVDLTAALKEQGPAMPEGIKTECSKKVITVWNKADLVKAKGERLEAKGLRLSAKNGEVEELKRVLVETAKTMYHHNGTIISNARHYEALVRAQEAIRRVKEGLANSLSGEFLSMDLQDCLTALGEITGQISSQEVLNNIFAKFCIGK